MDELRGELKQVLDLTTRVDERVKLIAERQAEMNARLNHIIEAHNDLTSRVRVLESGRGNQKVIIEKVDELADRILLVESTGSPYLRERMKDTESEIKNIIKERIQLLNESSKELLSINQRLVDIEQRHKGFWAKIKHFWGMIIHGVWVIIVCWLLYKFGLNTPPLP